MLGGTARSLGRLATRGERSLVTSSSAEAREALAHVDDRLDRNRVS